jgi:uncharacterized repeat protein (TIGR01451 family)
VNLSLFPDLKAAMDVIDKYFAVVYPNEPGKGVQDAAGYIGDWIDANHCEEPVGEARIRLTKTADPMTFSAADHKITYEFIAENMGTVRLKQVIISDPLPGLSALSCTIADVVVTQPVILDLGSALRCTASYTTTEEDVYAGQVDNTATVTGRDPQGVSVTDSADVTVTGPVQSPALSLVKSADKPDFTAYGEAITYSYLLTNTGNVPLYPPYRVEDDKIGMVHCPTEPTSLAQGDSVICTADYYITWEDVDVGSVENTAKGSALDSKGKQVFSNEDTEMVWYAGNVGECSFSQGYWFAKPGVVWPHDVTVGGLTFTQEEAQAFWPATTVMDKAFTQYATIVLSRVDVSLFPELAKAMEVIDSYFLNDYPGQPGKEVQKASGYIGDWIDANHCEEPVW